MEARESWDFDRAVAMRRWDHSLGPHYGLGDKIARTLLLVADGRTALGMSDGAGAWIAELCWLPLLMAN